MPASNTCLMPPEHSTHQLDGVNADIPRQIIPIPSEWAHSIPGADDALYLTLQSPTPAVSQSLTSCDEFYSNGQGFSVNPMLSTQLPACSLMQDQHYDALDIFSHDTPTKVGTKGDEDRGFSPTTQQVIDSFWDDWCASLGNSEEPLLNTDNTYGAHISSGKTGSFDEN